MSEKVACRTPNPGKTGVTHLPAWKFNSIRAAILAILREKGEVRWGDLTAMVSDRLTDEQRANMGSVGWHTISVKLELEVRGEIVRGPGKGPQTIRLA